MESDELIVTIESIMFIISHITNNKQNIFVNVQ